MFSGFDGENFASDEGVLSASDHFLLSCSCSCSSSGGLTEILKLTREGTGVMVSGLSERNGVVGLERTGVVISVGATGGASSRSTVEAFSPALASEDFLTVSYREHYRSSSEALSARRHPS